MQILPYFPLSKPLRGADDAQRFDTDILDAHPSLVAYCRPLIEGEFIDAPQALRNALAKPLMRPFRHVVEVRRGGGELFPPAREALQVRVVDGFDSSIAGTLQGGFLMNASTDRQPEPMSKGELSLALIAPPQ